MKTRDHQPTSAQRLNTGVRSLALCGTAMLAVFASSNAYAAGTLAGTDITNIATASYESGGSTVDIDSNAVVIKVDELLDVTAVSSDPGDVITTNGATNVVSTFRVTNTGNGSEALRLTPNVIQRLSKWYSIPMAMVFTIPALIPFTLLAQMIRYWHQIKT